MSSNLFSLIEFIEATWRSEGVNILKLSRLHKGHMIKTRTTMDQLINIYVMERKQCRKHGAMLT